ncbi:cytochrome bd-I oxidase subunit CydX [Paraburkholderia antibiotica]|uniref:Cytochrome bd-I oxidase subunit CydX n=1 Tax=Paraburkholderia antibiotica TaxID=2728839 RepID=A0A7X9X813_9BURK|nr:cytochrome bd-I oxidase subunit CydX [Paraburkholderia antibiotica]NML33197.1 cytochrome bd-I oxidase subunit CydX [Paraburkholderia antibiotica]
MWYFSWVLGIGVALAFGIINVMWLESRETLRAAKAAKQVAR